MEVAGHSRDKSLVQIGLAHFDAILVLLERAYFDAIVQMTALTPSPGMVSMTALVYVAGDDFHAVAAQVAVVWEMMVSRQK
jgi:hypothetical protein